MTKKDYKSYNINVVMDENKSISSMLELWTDMVFGKKDNKKEIHD